MWSAYDQVETVENLSARRSWKPRSQCSTKAAIVATTSMCSIDPKAQLTPLPPFRPLASGGKTAAKSALRKSAICAPGQTRWISPSRAARSANQSFYCTSAMCSIDPKAQPTPLPPFRPLASGGKTTAESARRKSAICAPGQTRWISPSRAARSANQSFYCTSAMCSIDPKAQPTPLPPFRPLASGGKTTAESARRKSAICAPGQTRWISPSGAARSANQSFYCTSSMCSIDPKAQPTPLPPFRPLLEQHALQTKASTAPPRCARSIPKHSRHRCFRSDRF